MNIFDILSNDERVIVLSSAEDNQIYTWNQSLTLQCWEAKICTESISTAIYPQIIWEKVDVRVLMDTPGSFREAREAAIHWKNNT